MVKGSGIEDIKNTKLKSVMWERIAKDYQSKTGKVITGRAVMVKWHNYKYNVSSGKVSHSNDVKTQSDLKKSKSEAFDENVLVPDTILEYDNSETINEQSNFGIKVEVSDENGYKTNYGNFDVKTGQKRQRKKKYNMEVVIKLVEGSKIEDIKNAQLKSEMWENIAKNYQKITGKEVTGHAIRMRWKNFKYNTNEQFKNWKCKICNEVFENFSDLKDHRKIHRQQNYKCEICSKLFSKKSNLQHHIRSIHEGVKNHLCGFCDKAFSQASDLKKHVRNKHRYGSCA